MKYVFEIEGTGNSHIVKVSMEDVRMGIRSSQVIFEMNEDTQNLESIETSLLRLLDNVRLTVDERTFVQNNIKAFNKYLELQSCKCKNIEKENNDGSTGE